MALANEQFLALFCMGWLGIAYLVGFLNRYFHEREGYWMQTRLARMSGQIPCDDSETALKSAMFLSMED